MFKTVSISILAALTLSMVGTASAASLEAKLVMPGGRSWTGLIVGRDGDWISFSTGTGGNPIRIGASTIEQLEFTLELDENKLNEMNRNREYERVITALNRTLEPYAAYSDIPSNLTQYNALLMELHYKVGAYDKSLEISSRLAADDRDPDLQEQSRVYRLLALIDSERVQEAEKQLAEYGWDGELSDDSAPQKLYVAAKLLALKKDYSSAMELVSKIIAFNSQNPDWMQPAELLCAEVYTELGMYDSAEEVIQQISLLYKDTNEDDKAQLLKVRIEELRAQQELQESLEAEEA
jgi:tetratricopeptide (TPR) repeat protein